MAPFLLLMYLKDEVRAVLPLEVHVFYLDGLDEVEEFVAGVDVELLVHVVDVGLRGAFGDDELLHDVVHRAALGKQVEHLGLTSGEQEGLCHRVAAAHEAAPHGSVRLCGCGRLAGKLFLADNFLLRIL